MSSEDRHTHALVQTYLHRQAAVVEAARDILRDADMWGQHTTRTEALRAALAALDAQGAR